MASPKTPPFIVEIFVYLALNVIVIAFRTYCRTKKAGIRGLAADDYIMMTAILPLVSESIIAYMVGTHFHGLTNSDMTDEARALLSPESEEFRLRVGGSKAIIGGWTSYTSLIWLVKASMCAFYLRLTSGLPGYKMRIYVGFGAIIISYIVCMCSILFSCRPFHKFWQINPYPGNFCEPAVNKLTVYLSMFLNFVTDMYIFMIPIPMLWSVHLPKVKKFGLGVLFSGGIIIMVFGFLRGFAILKSDATGPKEGAAWAVRESFVAVITTNLPMTWVWLRERLRPFMSSLSLSNTRGTRSGRRSGPEPGSIILEEGVDRRRSQRIKSLMQSDSSRSRNEAPADSDDNRSEEDMTTTNSGGILKEVQWTVTSSQSAGGSNV